MAYEIVKLPGESKAPGTGIGRTVLRTAARAGESILGLPGDIAAGVHGIAHALTSAAPSPIPTYEQVQKSLPISLPTSEQVRGVTKKLTGDYLEPQSKGESTYDEFVGDLASLLIPVKGKIPFKSAFKKALGSNFAGWLAEELGGGQGGKSASKIGYSLLSGIPGGRKALTEKAKQGLSTAKEIAKDDRQLAKGLKQSSHKILDFIESGVKTPAKNTLREPITSLVDKIRGDSISVKDALDINTDVKSLLADSETSKEVASHLRAIEKGTESVLKEYASKNKEFAQSFNAIQDIEKGLSQSSKVTEFLNKHANIKDYVSNPTVKALLKAGGAYSAFGTGGAVKIGAAAVGVREASQAFDLLKNSKEARTYYKNALLGAAHENAGVVVRNIKKLDAVANKNYPAQDSQYEIIKM